MIPFFLSFLILSTLTVAPRAGALEVQTRELKKDIPTISRDTLKGCRFDR
jgi:hypothetical protein